LSAQGSGGQIQRPDTTNFNVYSIAATGGDETQLTVAPGLDDGPEFSPDGAYIYFNSQRTGHMQIWRMHPDGSDQEEVLSEDSNDWFPHISPDGQWLAFLAYAPGVNGHPADKDVEIRLMPLKSTPDLAKSNPTKAIKVLAKLFGGQGTINVPSWSPDSKRLAFVSYEYLPGK
jgi:Tol biopolymer transport system component